MLSDLLLELEWTKHDVNKISDELKSSVKETGKYKR